MTLENVFEDYGRYYDLLYIDKNYSEEVEYISKIINSKNEGKKSLLEFGSGTGRHGVLLANAGHLVHGIELSAEMVALAAKAPGFSCEEADIKKIRKGKTFDAVLALFHVLSYQNTNEDVLSVFQSANEHLEIGGLFIFDFWYSPSVLGQKATTRVKRVSDDQLEITRIAEPEFHPNENRIEIKYSIYVNEVSTNKTSLISEVHSMRHFSLPEMQLFSDLAGFKILNSEEFLTGRRLGTDTWGACVVLEKV